MFLHLYAYYITRTPLLHDKIIFNNTIIVRFVLMSFLGVYDTFRQNDKHVYIKKTARNERTVINNCCFKNYLAIFLFLSISKAPIARMPSEAILMIEASTAPKQPFFFFGCSGSASLYASVTELSPVVAMCNSRVEQYVVDPSFNKTWMKRF